MTDLMPAREELSVCVLKAMCRALAAAAGRVYHRRDVLLFGLTVPAAW
jgi:hypothetical protein